MRYFNPKYQDTIDFEYTTNKFFGVEVKFYYQTNEDGDFDIINEYIDWSDLLELVSEILMEEVFIQTADEKTDYLNDLLLDDLYYYIERYIDENYAY